MRPHRTRWTYRWTARQACASAASCSTSEEKRKERIEAFRNALRMAETLSDADRKALLSLGFQDFPKVMTAHRGHGDSAKLESLTSARALFSASAAEIIALLDRFHDFSATPEFHQRNGKPQFDALVDRIRKEIFTFSTLSHSVQDHCRRVQNVWNAPDFTSNLAEHFGAGGLHSFIIELRNAMHHQHLFEADWALRWSEAGLKTSHFTLQKEKLLEEVEDWKTAKAYLAVAPDEIDVRSIVSDYRARHDAFYAWYLPWCRDSLPPAVAEYRQLCLEQRRSVFRSSWRFLLREMIRRGVDPMAHLVKYLTPDELAAAATLPPKSRVLVDHVIACIDEADACDDEIREMAYRLFDVAGATWAPPPPVVFSAKSAP